MADSVHLNQKLCFDSFAGLVVSLTSVAGHGVHLVDKYDAGYLFSCHSEQSFHYFLALSHIFAHYIATWYWEESGLGHLGGAGFGYESFACAGRAVEKNSFPGFTISFEYLRKTHGHDDGFLQRIFGFGETGNIIPADIGFLFDNNPLKVILHLAFLIFIFDIVENFLAFVIFDILAHLLDLWEEIIECLFEGALGGLILEFEELYEFEVDAFGCIFGGGHAGEVVLFIGGVEFDQFLLHFVFVDLPGVIDIHPLNLISLYNNLIFFKELYAI